MEAGVISRRNVIIGLGCAASAGTAYAMTPRKRVSLMGPRQLDDLVPTEFGDWVSRDVGDALALNSPDSLSAKLYAQLVTRLYTNRATGEEIVMLMAYGANQTDSLQLHRPEVCYPAFGYKLVRNEAVNVPLPGAVTIPARQLAAEGNGRQESVLYWTRIGEYLPTSGEEQRRDRLVTAFRGVIPDGVLMRFSTLADSPGGDWGQLKSFVAELVLAVTPDGRPVLIGTERSRALQGATTTQA
jgi:EpsI family protein